MTDQEWFQLHTEPAEIPASTVDWLRNLSPAAQKTVRKFPPSCVVKAKPGMDLKCPAPGRYGRVVSITRDGETVKVNPSDNDTVTQYAGMCDLDWLEVVGYWRGLDPERVAAILDATLN